MCVLSWEGTQGFAPGGQGLSYAPHLLLKMSLEAHVVSYPIGGMDALSGCTGAQATSGSWHLLPSGG